MNPEVLKFKRQLRQMPEEVFLEMLVVMTLEVELRAALDKPVEEPCEAQSGLPN